MTTVNIDRGVVSLVAGGAETRIEFMTQRRAWRLVADIVDAHAAGVQDEDLRDALRRMTERLRGAMDDGSKEMKALTESDGKRH